jgi:hypothetical protein
MGKHETSYPRIDRDHYPTPAWVTSALAEHIDLRRRVIWECAAGNGQMAEALAAAGAAEVYCTDIARYGYPLDETFDFLSAQNPKLPRFDGIVTNPAYGNKNALSVAFTKLGLERIRPGGFLALLLMNDIDSGVTRTALFRDHPHFVAKIVLTKRVIWFKRSDGEREGPKENHAWFIWQRPLLHVRRPPLILYAPETRHGVPT